MQLVKPIGLMAVIVDEELRLSETLDVDQIRVVSMTINVVQGFANFVLAFGGIDSTGRFHPDHKHAEDAFPVVIQRANQPAEFDRLFTEVGTPGSIKTTYEPDYFEVIAEQILLPTAYKLMWGAEHKYPDMEVQIAGRTVFSQQIVADKEKANELSIARPQ